VSPPTPTVCCGCQARAHSPLAGVVLSPYARWRRLLTALPEGERPLGPVSYFSVEGSGLHWTEPVRGEFCPCQRGLSRYHGDHGNYACSGERDPMPGIEGLEANTCGPCCQVRVGVYGYVPSCQASNGVAFQGPGDHGACSAPKSPWVVREGPQGSTRWQYPTRSRSWGDSSVRFIPEVSYV
jgi:hypothetical protein